MDVNEIDENAERLSSEIAELVQAFEDKTGVRVDMLNIDNRMRGVGGCAAHHINVCVDSEPGE